MSCSLQAVVLKSELLARGVKLISSFFQKQTIEKSVDFSCGLVAYVFVYLPGRYEDSVLHITWPINGDRDFRHNRGRLLWQVVRDAPVPTPENKTIRIKYDSGCYSFVYQLVLIHLLLINGVFDYDF